MNKPEELTDLREEIAETFSQRQQQSLLTDIPEP